MADARPILGILIDGSLDRLDPVGTVNHVDPGTDGRPTPSYWMTSVLSPLDGQSFGAMYAKLNQILQAAQVSIWSIQFANADPVIFDGFIKRLAPDFANGVVQCDFRLNGPPR